MKLSYLHPSVFTPDRSKVKVSMDRPFFLVRLSGLSAHHDFGMKGITEEVLEKIIRRLEQVGSVYISSEKPLPARYKEYLLKIPVSEIHHYLYFASMLICDSQSMTVEAAILGTPSIRISSFSGRISVLEELELKYHLTYGFQPNDEAGIFNKLEELLSITDLRGEFMERRRIMLAGKIDVAAFLTGFIDHYPYRAEPLKNAGHRALDFTPASYRDFLEMLISKGYTIQPYEDFVAAPAERSVISRHDVDARPDKSLEFARLEYSMGIRGTYYFRATNGKFQAGIIKEIASMGHEIGYHYEDLYQAKGDFTKAIRMFEQNLANLRELCPVKTICMDGHTFSKWNNLDLWKDHDYRKYDIIGEPYLDTDFDKVLYLTDTGRRWNAVRFSLYDKVKTKFPYQDKSTFDLLRDLESGSLPGQIMITLHPQRWHEGSLPWLYEYSSQWVINRIKYAIIKQRSA